MSRSRAPSSRWTNLSEELEQLLADVPKLTIEEHREWRELANMMQNVMAPLEAFFQIIFGEVGKVYAVKWNDVLDDENYHNIVYNKDLDQPAILAGWTSLRDFYQLIEDHLVSLTHYGNSAFFLTIFKTSCLSRSFPRCHSLYHKVPDFVTFKVYLTRQKVTYSNLNASSCSIIGGRHLKIGVRWKHFCETLSLTADMEIVFVFIDPNVNRVLYWPCL
ncbi:hypothetical protein GmHk_11G032462 [Glycine max]|nr:hypothetical protein GmHk_11G032462 [Glycine max]